MHSALPPDRRIRDVNTIRRLTTDDARDASTILLAAAAWALEHRAYLWSDWEISADNCAEWAAVGVLFGAFEGDEMAATFSLTDVDTLYWPDTPAGHALYLHKVAVRRASTGSGWMKQIIDWAVDETRRRNVTRLRLDTLAFSRLVGLYESHHFVLIDTVPLAIGGRSIVRMERVLT
jgi:GNAT superfamily N-acetyltransferase